MEGPFRLQVVGAGFFYLDKHSECLPGVWHEMARRGVKGHEYANLQRRSLSNQTVLWLLGTDFQLNTSNV